MAPVQTKADILDFGAEDMSGGEKEHLSLLLPVVWPWPPGNSGNVFGGRCPQEKEGQKLTGLLHLGSGCAADGWLNALEWRQPDALFFLLLSLSVSQHFSCLSICF